MNENLTHAYAHLLVDMHLAVFAPAFTFSLYESECSRKPQVRIASVVSSKPKKKHNGNKDFDTGNARRAKEQN